MCLISLLMRAKFEGNPIMCLHLMAVFCKCAKLGNEENERLFKGLYFRNTWRNLLQICYVLSPDMLAPAQRIWSCLVRGPRSYERA